MDVTTRNLTVQNRGKRGSKDQKTHLISFMEENINFAHERFDSDCGAAFQKYKWDELSSALNALGGAKKSAEQWKQYWRDLKRNVKAQATEEKRRLEESGINGLSSFRSNLDDNDRRVISIITPDVIDGDGESQERGLNRPTLSYTEVMDPAPEYLIDEDEEDPVQMLIPVKPPTKRRRLTQPPIRETAGKLDAYIKFEKKKLEFEKEKFNFEKQQTIAKIELERQALELEKRKVEALEGIGQYYLFK